MARISRVATLTFTAYRESEIAEWRYLLLFQTSRRAHCVGLEVDASGAPNGCDSGRDIAFRCATGVRPHVDSLDLARVAIKYQKETTKATPHPSAEAEIGGRPAGNCRQKRERDATESEDSDGYVSGSDHPDGTGDGGIEEQAPLQLY